MKLLYFLSILCIFQCSASETELVLADHGKTDYVVVAGTNPSVFDRLALKELCEYFKKATGVELKTVPEAHAATQKVIFLGATPQAQKILGEKTVAALRDEESLIRTKGDDLFLLGGGKFGTVYAVYAFLENQLGCRWYSIQGDEKVPTDQKLVIPALDYREKPHFKYRMLTTAEYHRHPEAMKFLFRNRMNMIWGNYEKSGLDVAKTVDTPMCHTMFYYIPAEKNTNPYRWTWNEDKEYFKTNPDFFSMDQNGRRVKNLQLCFSNPALRKEFSSRVKERIGRTGKQIYTIAAMDWPGSFCFCPACKKLESQYQTSAAPMLDYLIELCGDLKKTHPDVMILTSAYRKAQSEIPPRIKNRLPENLIVKVAPIDDDISKSFAHRHNQGTYTNIQNWNKLCDNVWIWYYPAYGGSPSADFERTALDTKMLAEANCNGMAYEHDYNVFQGLDFSDMMTWVLLKLYQKPDADWNALIRDFSDAYYGKASPLMLAYLQELQKIRNECRDFISWDATLTKYYTPRQILKWEKMFDEMERLTADSPNAKNHVQEARMSLDNLLLSRWHETKNEKNPYRVEQLKERILKTFDASLLRRYPAGNEAARNIWRKAFAETVEKNSMMAQVEFKPLPPPLNKIPPDKVRQAIPVNTPYAKVSKMPDAAYGIAMREPKKPLELPFTFGLHDFYNKKSVAVKALKKTQIKVDQFHLYKLGTVTISQKCRLWLTGSWSAHVELDSFHRLGFPDKLWDLYVSLKFEGPGYGASKAKENNVWLDRVILVELDK